MKLQFIHKTNGAVGASSLYCQWISTRQGDRETLVVVWMDRKMRAFAGEFSRGAGTLGKLAGVAKVTGDAPLHVRSDETRETHNEETRHA